MHTKHSARSGGDRTRAHGLAPAQAGAADTAFANESLFGLDEPSLAPRLASLSPAERKRIAAARTSGADILAWLAQDADDAVRAKVASNISTPAPLHMRLAHDGSIKVRRMLAANPHLTPAAFEVLAKDEAKTDGPGVLHALAANPGAPVSLLERLSKHAQADVRATVARNINCPVGMYERLMRDRDWTVRQGCADNPAAQAHFLEVLANDPEPEVRREVACHPNTAQPVLSRMCLDDDSVVRDIARERVHRALCIRLGVDEDNLEAIDLLLTMRWWTMSPTSPEVQMVLLVHPNTDLVNALL